MTTVRNSLAAIALTAAFNAQADVGLESCIATIQKEKQGDLVKIEKLNVAGKPVYEIEVRDPSKSEWEFMCTVDRGAIIEREREVDSAEHPAFKSKMKVTEQEATAIAIKAHPGTVEEVEFEIEENGDATYEIDIVDEQGVETKIEVDAATGKIVETSTEVWQIGEEESASR